MSATATVRNAPQHQYAMPCITSHISERTFVVLSRRLVQQLERFFTAQGTAFSLEEMPHPFAAPEEYERLERALLQIGEAVGILTQPGESYTPVLERAAELLRGAGC